MAKLEQKLINIVKEHALFELTVIKDEDGNQSFRFQDNGAMNPGQMKTKIIVGIISDDPYSEFFSHYSMSTGMLDQHLPKQYVETIRIESVSGKSSLSVLDKEIAVENEQIILETNGIPSKFAFIVKEEDLGQLVEYVTYDKYEREDIVMHGSTEEVLGQYSAWKVGGRSASQTRKGDLVVIPYEKSLTSHMEEELLFNLNSYAKHIDENKVKISTSIQSRIKMSASSGQVLPLFEGFKYIKTETEEFEGLDNETIVGDVYYFNTPIGVKKILVLREDFTVRLKQEIIAPNFKKDGSVEIVEKEEVFEKPATDGSSYIDMEYAYSKEIFKDAQIRTASVVKGMDNLVFNLENRLGYVAIMFGGAVKGDPAPYFENNDLETYLLGYARTELEEDENFLLLSNQLVRNIGQLNPDALTYLEEESYNILSRAYNQDMDAMKTFIDLKYEDDVFDEKEVDSENITVDMIKTNPDVFLDSDSFKKRLTDFIRKSTNELENAGRYYCKDSSFKHMVSDPYEVIRHMEKGRMAIDTLVNSDMKGIAPGHAISPRLKNGQYLIDERKAILGRYPMLHSKEIQVVNQGGSLFLDNESAENYASLIARGNHQGMLYYSLYDMTAEGQSGADYDGDTTTVIRNPELTKLVHSSDKFLDYSYLEGELVEGVPWKEDQNEKLIDIIGEDDTNFLLDNGVDYKQGDFVLNKELLEATSIRERIYKTIVQLDGMTNASNDIGGITNINSAVSEMIMLLSSKMQEVLTLGHQDLANKINEEINGYKKLNMLLASAIRWEIDKAKHGGQFHEEMSFLKLLLSREKEVDMDKVKNAERMFGISLMRLFAKNNNMNDEINRGLDSLGIPRIHLERSESDTSRLNLSRTISLGKGIDKGTEYNTRYTHYINYLQELANDYTYNKNVYEYDNGLLSEASAIIAHIEDEKGIEIELEDFYDARMAISRGEEVNNPVRLLFSYRQQIREVSRAIEEKEYQLRLQLNKMRRGYVLNAGSLGLEALMKKVNLPREERKECYKLLAKKQLVIENHKGLGERFTPVDSYESLLLFSKLYQNNVIAQNNNRIEVLNNEEKVKETRHKLFADLNKKWIAKFGDKKPTEQDIINSKEWVDSRVEREIYNDNGFESIISLFPISSIQFLEFLADKELSQSNAGKNVVVYMNTKNNQNISADVYNYLKSSAKSLSGKRIAVENGDWGIFTIEKDNMKNSNRRINMSQKELESLKGHEEYSKIKDMRFERGSHLWSRKRDGRIISLQVYRGGIKLFLEDSKEVM